jgi:hypothetical protein
VDGWNPFLGIADQRQQRPHPIKLEVAGRVRLGIDAFVVDATVQILDCGFVRLDSLNHATETALHNTGAIIPKIRIVTSEGTERRVTV